MEACSEICFHHAPAKSIAKFRHQDFTDYVSAWTAVATVFGTDNPPTSPHQSSTDEPRFAQQGTIEHGYVCNSPGDVIVIADPARLVPRCRIGYYLSSREL